jgi:toxin ParE1/3/4
MTLRVSESAGRDLEDIYDYIARDSPNAAIETLRNLFETMELLIGFPYLGHASHLGTRELVKPPFAVVYRLVGDVISIEAVSMEAAATRKGFSLRTL